MNIMNYKKTEHFEPIAMKCTQEQFESIRDILESFGCIISQITDFSSTEYLTNIFNVDKISNIAYGLGTYKGIEIKETFNAETFLKACGIVSEPLYQLTSKEVVHAYENPQWLKDTFKECFETELEVGKWYKVIGKNILFCKLETGFYGFLNGVEKTINWNWVYNSDLQPTTEKEVKEALVKEAIKRGFKEGIKYKNKYSSIGTIKESCYCYDFKSNILYQSNNECNSNKHYIFKHGEWIAQIIPVPTYTIPEAESKFNIKIKAV